MPSIIAKNNEDTHKLYSHTHFFIEMGMALAISGMFIILLGALRLPASIPIFYLSYRRNPRVAMFTGIILGLIILVVKPIIHPVNILESPLEYLCIGLAGFFPMGERKFSNKFFQWIYDCRGIIIAATLRFIVTFTGSFIIYSTYLPHNSVTFRVIIAFLDEGPIFIPYLIFSMVLIPFLVRYKFDVKELK